MEELEVAVRAAIADGWQPLGGVSVDGATFTLVQAMVRYADEAS